MIARILLYSLVALAALAAGFAAYVRLAPMEEATWHIDPDGARRTGKPNDFLVADGGDRPAVISGDAPAQVMARLGAVAMGEPRTERLTGSVEEGFVTYVQRSRLMGYPDAISVRVTPEGAGSRLTIWSRSRDGQSDLGVNRARVERWLSASGL